MARHIAASRFFQGPTPRPVGKIAEEFTATYVDTDFDAALNEFVLSGIFTPPGAEAFASMSEATQDRILRLHRLEQHASPLLTTLREKIFAVCEHTENSQYWEVIRSKLLEVFTYMLRVHIDDKDRKDTGLPGVSHQIMVTMRVIDALGGSSLAGADTLIVGAAMLHDIVEDHERLIMLELPKIRRLGLPKNATDKTKVLALLASETRPKMADIIEALSFDRVEKLMSTRGISREKAESISNSLGDRRKHRMYFRYVKNIFGNKKNLATREGQAVALIKLCDLEDNALTIGAIKNKYLAQKKHIQETQERHGHIVPADLVRLEETRKNFNKLRDKYKPVLEKVLLPKLLTWSRDWGPQSPISKHVQKTGVIAEIHHVLETVYREPLVKSLRRVQ